MFKAQRQKILFFRVEDTVPLPLFNSDNASKDRGILIAATGCELRALTEEGEPGK
jgi:hypothetical protein